MTLSGLEFLGIVIVGVIAVFAVLPWFGNIFERYSAWVDRRFK